MTDINENINSILNNLFDKLYPINRSITGPGIRKSLGILKKHINFKITNIPSNTKVFDWKIPKEWELIEGYIKYKGKYILNSKNNNLSVVNYSHSINKDLNLDQLKKNIYTHPKLKNAIPYVTSYYEKIGDFV